MMQQQIEILSFQAKHQDDIDAMMERIASEFAAPVFTAQSKKILDVCALPGHQFWVATNGTKVAGTIGMLQLANGNLVLKSMFVDGKYRGQGVSDLLLDTFITQGIRDNYRQVYLGTMPQFAGGQKFYEKKGFTKCDRSELPADFVINPLDTLFYTRRIAQP